MSNTFPSTAGTTTSKSKTTDTVAMREAQSGALLVVGLIAVMWAVNIVDTIMKHRLDQRFGVKPHVLGGLEGIPFAPFLHANWQHLIGNTVPFAVMGFLIVIGGISRFIKTFLIITLVSGLGIWVAGSSGSVHFGASGVVFGFLGYLVSRGFFEKKFRQIILGVVVGVVYGGLLWGVLPTTKGVSWQGHLFGFIGGVLAAWLLRPRKPAVTAGT